MMNFYNYDVTKYGRCKIDDLLFEMFYDDNFEMIFWKNFHFLKEIVLTVILKLLSFRDWVSTIC